VLDEIGIDGIARRARAPGGADHRADPSLDTARGFHSPGVFTACSRKTRNDLDDVVERAAHFAQVEGFAKGGERIVVTAGVPLGTPGATNLLRVAFVGGR